MIFIFIKTSSCLWCYKAYIREGASEPHKERVQKITVAVLTDQYDRREAFAPVDCCELLYFADSGPPFHALPRQMTLSDTR